MRRLLGSARRRRPRRRPSPAPAQRPTVAAHHPPDLRHPSSRAKPFGPSRWLGDGVGLHDRGARRRRPGAGPRPLRCGAGQPRGAGAGRAQLMPQGDSLPLEIEEYAWSPDESSCSSSPTPSRSGGSTPGATTGCWTGPAGSSAQARRRDAKPSTLMFAKFSPDGAPGRLRPGEQPVRRGPGERRDHRRSPPTARRTIINGTFDWVYEEELMNYYADGWRWSPDGQSHRLLAAQRRPGQGLLPRSTTPTRSTRGSSRSSIPRPARPTRRPGSAS